MPTRMHKGIFVGLALSLGILPFACSDGDQCMRLSDCASGYVCQVGVCVKALPPGSGEAGDVNVEGSSDALGDRAADGAIDGETGAVDGGDAATSDVDGGETGNDATVTDAPLQDAPVTDVGDFEFDDFDF